MRAYGFPPLVLTLLMLGCMMRTEQPVRNHFPFAHEGRDYEIVGVADSLGARNYLLQREEGRIVFRAQDSDRDGQIDTVLLGDLAREEADRIYAVGIAQARDRGQVRGQPTARPGESAESESRQPRVLVFSKTTGYRHTSIPDGIAAIHALGAEHGFEVEATEDAGVFTDDALASFAAVVFLNTTQDVLDAAQQAAFERYIRAGGGFAGVHAAADTEYDWPWYGGLVGAYFEHHPEIQAATVRVEDPAHPSTDGLPVEWVRTDEWYDFRSSPRGRVRVLATLDEASYEGGRMGEDHPIAWCHAYDGGRAWYTAMGHTAESYAEPLFRRHLLGGIRYAAGLAEGDCTAENG